MGPSGIRLAIVDDHRMLLTALSEWIRGAATDIELVAAVSSWPDLLAHPQFPVDVVLLDLDLRDNLPISVKLRALGTVGARAVVMSTYSEPGVVREALASGALGYIVKSERAETIVLAVRAAHSGSTFLSPRLAAQLETTVDASLLSAQERRIMALYSSGDSAKRIAAALFISEETAKSHLKRIRRKYRLAGIDVSTKVALREEAIRSGIIAPGERGERSDPRRAAPR
ncbi:LuxR family transcriptional regulator [Subtercola boreus]|uniref:LuxR family transcriptional regulator n=1 Tax=Subtercola boreus TaxID=120213 RepID=A0A3E0VJW6_9MICO|nr:response regulator transcription factor [Subtercola boreus]RFA10176.1 LuxR family transcriptional regulator [Subtercola boreus]TQL52658.1 DNA-binding NarL/FixJ family response regulator [Subtercola boreus]